MGLPWAEAERLGSVRAAGERLRCPAYVTAIGVPVAARLVEVAVRREEVPPHAVGGLLHAVAEAQRAVAVRRAVGEAPPWAVAGAGGVPRALGARPRAVAVTPSARCSAWALAVAGTCGSAPVNLRHESRHNRAGARTASSRR